MLTSVSFKNLLLMLLGGLSCAVGAAFLLNFIFSGPKLGLHYDFLSDRKPANISREILIINTEEYVEGSDFFLVLMTLTEMEADNLILTSRLSPSSSPITVTETEIRRRFMDEYQLIGSNVRNLFEGIRLGSVSPVQAPEFVDRFVELAEQGRDRLITTLIDRDEDLIRSVAVFGNFLESYSRPYLDKDGKLRRVLPLDSEFEHPVYLFLKNRYEFSQIEASGNEKILWLRTHDGKNIDIHLDSEGFIITPGSSAIRRIDIELFREYEEVSLALFESLAASYEIGGFVKTLPEKIPLFLGEYANALLEELLKNPNSENRSAWIVSRANYFKSLDEYFNSLTDILLINEYEEQIADTDSSNVNQLARLIARRDELKQVFLIKHESYERLSVIHSKLKDALSMSLCLMGFEQNAEYSAILANTLITGSHVRPVSARYVILFSITSSFIVLLLVFIMRPVFLLCAGILLSFLSALIFNGLFIYYSYWIDPVIVLGSSLMGLLAIFICKCAYLNYRALSFRSAYKAAVPKNILQNLITRGRPGLSEINVTYTAVIAIKDFNLFGREDHEKSKDAGKIKRTFYTTAKKALFNAGAVIAGYEGDTILACFGSPLEIKPTLTTYKWSKDGQPLAKSYHPVDKACVLVKELLKNEKITWRFAIDAGECSFSWSPETGFSVSGSPAVRVRMLVSKTARLKTRALITEAVREKIDFTGERISSLQDENDIVYELPVT